MSKNEPLYKNESIILGNKSFKFKNIIQEAYLNRISLSSTGFYSTPNTGTTQVRIAYVLNKEALQESIDILAAALKVYPGYTN